MSEEKFLKSLNLYGIAAELGKEPDFAAHIEQRVRDYTAQAVKDARIDELKRHFVPHGKNQLETVYILPGKKISNWGTSDARLAYEYRLQELES